MAKNLTVREKRCEDCVCLIDNKGVLCCDELWGRPCNDIAADECPEEITLEEAEELNEKTKGIRVDHGGARAEETKKRAPRKPDLKKEGFMEFLANLLNENGVNNVNITNKSKIVEFTIDGEWYKIDFSYMRNKNKALKGVK